jgi:acetyl-CoA acetyltransferase
MAEAERRRLAVGVPVGFVERIDLRVVNRHASRRLAGEDQAHLLLHAHSHDAEHVNPNGGAIAIGHPLGASGARLATTALVELERRRERYALCTMCVGVGQGIALLIERV